MCAGANPFPSIQPGLATPTPSLGSWGGAGVGFFPSLLVIFVVFLVIKIKHRDQSPFSPEGGLGASALNTPRGLASLALPFPHPLHVSPEPP